MKPILFIYVICFLLTASRAGAQLESGLNKDSLRRVLATMSADTEKVYALIRLGQQYENNLPDSALFFYRSAGALSDQLHFPSGFARYVANYTAVLNVQGKFDESLRLNLAAIDTCKKYGLRQQYIKALSNTGAVYQYKQEYEHAATYYLQALPLVEADGDYQMLSFICGNLCGLYRNLQQTAKAHNYATRAIDYSRKGNDISSLGFGYNNMGNVLKDEGNYEGAILFLDSAYRIALRLDDINLQETVFINMGDAYAKRGDYDRSIQYFRKALPLAVKLDDVSGQAFASQGIAISLYHKRAFEPARQELLHTIGFARRFEQKEQLASSLLLMSDILIATGRLDSSRVYRDEYDSVTNKLLNAGLLKNVQELETKYGVEKSKRELLEKDLLLEQRARESLRQRIWLGVSVAALALSALLLVIGYRVYRQRRMLNIKEVEALRAEQENIRLKAQLDGQSQERRRISQEIHDDIGSGLTSMVFLSRTLQGDEGVAGRIQHNAESLMNKMNEIIWTMNQEEDTVDSLFSYIRVNLAEALETAGIEYRFLVPDSIPALALSQEKRRNIYLVAKEAVHNVIKHAGARLVTISMMLRPRKLDDGTIGLALAIVVKDDGKGFDGSEGRRFGNGLKNMRRRAMEIGATLEIAQDGGTSLVLQVPI